MFCSDPDDTLENIIPLSDKYIIILHLSVLLGQMYETILRYDVLDVVIC